MAAYRDGLGKDLVAVRGSARYIVQTQRGRGLLRGVSEATVVNRVGPDSDIRNVRLVCACFTDAPLISPPACLPLALSGPKREADDVGSLRESGPRG